MANVNSNDLELAFNNLEQALLKSRRPSAHRSGLLEGIAQCRIVLRELVSQHLKAS